MKLLQGDCREVMATLDAASVDAIVTDPPYHLTTGKKGGAGEASVNLESPYGRARVTTGFMGMKWDGGDVAMRVETWVAALRVLKPGGHLLAFSGTRTYHRMVCAIEDAGFEIRDQIGWLYGSGFPKSHNGPWGGTALKPAWEPIVVARRPLIGTVEANWKAYGTGALNIDGCRVCVDVVADAAQLRTMQRSRREGNDGWGMSVGGSDTPSVVRADGRWPANIIHDGSEEVLQAFPETESGKPAGIKAGGQLNVYGKYAGGIPVTGFGDKGSAARFFYTAKASAHDRNDGLVGMPEQKVHGPSGDGRVWDIPGSKSTARANFHPTVKPTDLMRYLCRLVTPAGGTVLDPFMGSGSTLKAAELEGFDAIGIELDLAYIEIARRRIGSDAPLFAEVA